MRVRVDAAGEKQEAGGVDDGLRGVGGMPGRISLMTAPSMRMSARMVESALTTVPFWMRSVGMDEFYSISREALGGLRSCQNSGNSMPYRG